MFGTINLSAPCYPSTSLSYSPKNKVLRARVYKKQLNTSWTNIFNLTAYSGNKISSRNDLYGWLRYPTGVSRCNYGKCKFRLTHTPNQL